MYIIISALKDTDFVAYFALFLLVCLLHVPLRSFIHLHEIQGILIRLLSENSNG